MLRKNAGTEISYVKRLEKQANKGSEIYPQPWKMQMSVGQRRGKGYSFKKREIDPFKWTH